MSISPFAQGHLDLIDRGYNGVYGASRVSQLMSPNITHLHLAHNTLGDGGGRVLFQWIPTYRNTLREIHLISCGLSNNTMLAVAGFLRGNVALQKLFLSNNALTGDEVTTKELVVGLNESRLQVLSLTSNLLGDRFADIFLSSLSAIYLDTIFLSMIGLTVASVLPIITFLSSSQAKSLRHIALSGNALGMAGVMAIVKTVEAHNFAPCRVELHANEVDGDLPMNFDSWQPQLLEAMMRNRDRRLEVVHAAFETLQQARVLLPRGRQLPISVNDTVTLTEGSALNNTESPYLNIPNEIRLLILRFAADPTFVLSDAQFVRVVDYASSWRTPEVPWDRHTWLASMGCLAPEPGRIS